MYIEMQMRDLAASGYLRTLRWPPTLCFDSWRLCQQTQWAPFRTGGAGVASAVIAGVGIRPVGATPLEAPVVASPPARLGLTATQSKWTRRLGWRVAGPSRMEVTRLSWSGAELQLGNLPLERTNAVHTVDDVPIVALGPGAARFNATFDNTEVCIAIVDALGIDARNP